MQPLRWPFRLLPRTFFRSRFARRAGILPVFALAASSFAAAQFAATTYHYDNYRTSWNSEETTLTVSAVQSSSFGMLEKVTLDDTVDAQPLVVPNVTITAGSSPGVYNVVYVVTENNSIYAINTANGKVLLSVNFGAPVSGKLGCAGVQVDVGINSTPVIDVSTNTMYVMIYTLNSGVPTYTIHALNLGSLTDQVTPQVVTASNTLTNGKTYNFNATYQRQRPALLMANGNVYAAFGSFCDAGPSKSRGWLLGWQTGTLTPLASNHLMNTLYTSPDKFYLASIWMSGYGPAADDDGNLVFVTGNSDPSGTTYDGVNNIPESTIELSPDLTTVIDLFTPDNEPTLDEQDLDFGSGGAMVLPDQPGLIPRLAVAAGKEGTMFLMNEENLGGYSTTENDVLGSYSIGPCWCGESYFVDPVDGIARVVSSGGNSVMVWKLLTSPTPSLINVVSSAAIGNANSGFFTTISSNGASNAIIWAVSRPTPNQTKVTLYAFAPDLGGSTLNQIFEGKAGQWVLRANNLTSAPVVANGQVFVTSYKTLVIFGIKEAGVKYAAE
jgi:hypothetical protein